MHVKELARRFETLALKQPDVPPAPSSGGGMVEQLRLRFEPVSDGNSANEQSLQGREFDARGNQNETGDKMTGEKKTVRLLITGQKQDRKRVSVNDISSHRRHFSASQPAPRRHSSVRPSSLTSPSRRRSLKYADPAWKLRIDSNETYTAPLSARTPSGTTSPQAADTKISSRFISTQAATSSTSSFPVSTPLSAISRPSNAGSNESASANRSKQSGALAVAFKSLRSTPSPSAPELYRATSTSDAGSLSEGSLELIELIPDVSDGDLDDIDGVERVEDELVSEGKQSAPGSFGTFRRIQTSELAELSPQSSPQPSEQPLDELPSPRRGKSLPAEAKQRYPQNELARADNVRKELFSSSQLQRATSPNGPEYESTTGDFVSYFSNPRRPRPRSMPVQHLPPRAVPLPAGPRHESTLSRGDIGHRDRSSLKKLPKAKVLIARRRTQLSNGSRMSSADGVSGEESGPRKLVREYSNPKELLEGQVSMVELCSEENEGEVHRSEDNRENSNLPLIAAEGGFGLIGRPPAREKMFRRRYDEFLEAEQLASARRLDHGDIDAELIYAGGASKQRYRNKKRLFGGGAAVGKVEKDRHRHERQEKRIEDIRRRSTMLSGALDRVSMAADPWIDFITDANAVPVANKATGPLRRAIKRIFGRGKENAALVR